MVFEMFYRGKNKTHHPHGNMVVRKYWKMNWAKHKTVLEENMSQSQLDVMTSFSSEVAPF